MPFRQHNASGVRISRIKQRAWRVSRQRVGQTRDPHPLVIDEDHVADREPPCRYAEVRRRWPLIGLPRGSSSFPVVPPELTIAASGVRRTAGETPSRSGGTPDKVASSTPIT